MKGKLKRIYLQNANNLKIFQTEHHEPSPSLMSRGEMKAQTAAVFAI